MNSINSSELSREFVKSKTGLTGIGILACLIIISIIAATTIPIDTFKQWNNPSNWISYPKTSMPVWVNYFVADKIPEHIVMENPSIVIKNDVISVASYNFSIDYPYDDFPNDFIYEFSAEYSGSPLLQISVIKPDQSKLLLLSTSLPYSDKKIIHNERIFSTDNSIKKNVQMQSAKMGLYKEDASSEDLIFSDKDGQVLKGGYLFLANVYGVDEQVEIFNSKLILGGKAFGLMGTDELRRDLMVGLLWGTPLALFIGIAVAVGSVVVGLIYGVYAGFKGRKTDEALMRFNDVIYALPALPFLIILAVTISNSIFMMIGFLMIFSWVGIAKVSRSMALQIKTKQYVEASKIMGQKNSRIIFKHIIPQLLPYTFASIAISVPAAITTEAGLSFLGLGDPTFPTWGQILHDANTFGAAARGLWWWIVPPGIMIAITGLSFVFIGNALDSIINPKLKK
ncbi:MAG: ABC transporter permease [Thermoproteota archaeon]|nr:ABC transporter permease [Thermoproteota archaeon]